MSADRITELAGWGSELPEGTARGVAIVHAFGSWCGEVIEVRIDDGRIVVTKVHVVLDCGLAVNPDLVVSQVEGSVIFGLSAALWGEITVEQGLVQQDNFDRYRLMRMHECPEIIVELLPGSDEPGGVGEPAVAPLAPAVGNALFTLTGARLRRTPLQAEYERHLATEARE